MMYLIKLKINKTIINKKQNNKMNNKYRKQIAKSWNNQILQPIIKMTNLTLQIINVIIIILKVHFKQHLMTKK